MHRLVLRYSKHYPKHSYSPCCCALVSSTESCGRVLCKIVQVFGGKHPSEKVADHRYAPTL